MALDVEDVVDRAVGRDEPLCLTLRLESLHPSLSSSDRLWMWFAFIKPPVFGRWNYKHFYNVLYRTIVRGPRLNFLSWLRS